MLASTNDDVVSGALSPLELEPELEPLFIRALGFLTIAEVDCECTRPVDDVGVLLSIDDELKPRSSNIIDADLFNEFER